MTILSSELFQSQLKDILNSLADEDVKVAQNFKMYLDTILFNMPTKAKKYKKSIYFDDENIKDIQHQEYTIIFLIENDTYVILGITKGDLQK
jgi:hypothetical protein